jgi:hypothetical protein
MDRLKAIPCKSWALICRARARPSVRPFPWERPLAAEGSNQIPSFLLVLLQDLLDLFFGHGEVIFILLQP